MIGILTFYWADDYGAMLQSYALKTYLNQYGGAVLVPYFPRALRGRYRVIHYNRADSIPRRLYKMAGQLRPENLRRAFKRRKRMKAFRQEFLTGERKSLDSSKDIFKYKSDINVYVAGSDQVWNPEITEGFQEGYFCTFRKWKKSGARYAAYAASIGMERLNEKYDRKLAGLLSNFDVISIREPLSKPYIAKQWGKEPEVVLDPVFLLKKKEWEVLSGKLTKEAVRHMIYGADGAFSGDTAVNSGGRYIAVYDTEYSPEMAQYLRKLEKYSGLAVAVISAVHKTYRWTEKEKRLVGLGPLEFLGVLQHAAYVVTNSFHGTAFSIILKKQFAAFPHSTRGARMLDILRTARLEDRLVSGGKREVRIDEKIDWDEVDKALEKEITHSKAFIQNEILASPEGTGRRACPCR